LTDLSPIARFVAYFGDLGPRWGLPTIPCQVHAFLYLHPKPAKLTELKSALSLDLTEAREAIEFLQGYGLASGNDRDGWSTATDPWDMLITGLEKRRERELPEALETLETCWRDASADDTLDLSVSRQIKKMLTMVEDIAAVDAQAQKLSAKTVRRLIGLGGFAARMLGSPKRR
jgi:DNA-binding transcriptional regulator GbsR (MarR family)